MTVIISSYRGYTISDIKIRTDVPEQSHIVTGTTNASCNNISITKIAQILGVDTSTSLKQLCLHPNVNKWSGYSPFTRDVSGTPDLRGDGAYLKHILPTRYRTGYWSGYNHGALTPYIYNSNASENLSIVSGGTAIFDCAVVLGELKLMTPDIVGESPLGLAFIVWDGATLIGTDVQPLSSFTDNNISSAFQVTKSGVIATKTYACQLRLVNSTTTYTYAPTNVVCGIEELSDYTKQVRIQEAIYVSITGNRTPTFGSSGATPNYNLSTGAITSNGLTVSANCTTSLVVTAWVETWDASILTDIYYLRNAAAGTYTAGSNVITQHPSVYTDPGSTTHPQLNRVIWTNLGITKLLPMSSYDLVIRINFAGT